MRKTVADLLSEELTLTMLRKLLAAAAADTLRKHLSEIGISEEEFIDWLRTTNKMVSYLEDN